VGRLTATITGKFLAFDTSPLIYYIWIRTPDAIQIATALQNEADLIVTNDERWKRLTEIQVVLLKDFLEPQV
jgi:predicted nucleic acid-binding protein